MYIYIDPSYVCNSYILAEFKEAVKVGFKLGRLKLNVKDSKVHAVCIPLSSTKGHNVLKVVYAIHLDHCQFSVSIHYLDVVVVIASDVLVHMVQCY